MKTDPVCPANCRRSCPVRMSHKHKRPPAPAEANHVPQGLYANEPIRAASHRLIVIGDEADPLCGHVLIEFIPIGGVRLDD